MPLIVKPHTFIDGTDAVAAEVNSDFDTLYTWVNTQGIHRDGTLAFTAHPSGPSSDPSADNQYARKAYVDVPRFAASASGTLFGTGGTATLLGVTWTPSTSKQITVQPNGFTVTRAGTYLVGCSVQFATSTAGDRRNLGLRVNAGTMFITDSQQDGTFTSGFGNTVCCVSMVTLAASDQLNVLYAHNSSGLTYSGRLWAMGIPGTIT